MAREIARIPMTGASWALAGAAVAVIAAFLVDSGKAQQHPAPPARTVQPIAAGVSLPGPPLLAGGPAPDLDLAFTAQAIGWIEPCG